MGGLAFVLREEAPGAGTPPGGRIAAMRRLGKARWLPVLCIFLIVVVSRATVLGDPNYQIDESFYLLVAQRMHAGDLLYVDVWDRKPPGIFLLFYLVGAIAPGMLAAHLAGAVSVFIGSLLVFRMAGKLTQRWPAALAAMMYAAMMARFGGAGVQTPVFYNTLMLAAATILVERHDALHEGRVSPAIHAAMVLAGAAITFKPTAAAEAAFLGLWTSAVLIAGGKATRWALTIAGLATAGAAPLLLCAGWFAATGYWAEFWQATVLSNFDRTYLVQQSGIVALVLLAQLGLPVALAVLSIALERRHWREPPRLFAAAWLLVSVAAFMAFPNKADHYVLPLLAPLAVVGAPFLARPVLGPALGAYAVVSFLVTGEMLNHADRAASKREMAEVLTHIRNHDPVGRLLVYAGPPYLYVALGARPLSPLAFPPHLFDRTEYDAGGRSTRSEVARIMAARPTTVVIQDPILAYAVNPDTTAMVRHYAAQACSAARRMQVRDMYGPYAVVIYTGCAAIAPRSVRR